MPEGEKQKREDRGASQGERCSLKGQNRVVFFFFLMAGRGRSFLSLSKREGEIERRDLGETQVKEV